MQGKAELWLVRIEVGKLPRSYKISGTEVTVVKDFRKRYTEQKLEPAAWIAYPRNAELCRISVVARDYSLDNAMSAAKALLHRVGK
jgi:hypothetical protein